MVAGPRSSLRLAARRFLAAVSPRTAALGLNVCVAHRPWPVLASNSVLLPVVAHERRGPGPAVDLVPPGRASGEGMGHRCGHGFALAHSQPGSHRGYAGIAHRSEWRARPTARGPAVQIFRLVTLPAPSSQLARL